MELTPTLTYKVKFNFKNQNFPHFELVHMMNNNLFKVGFPNLEEKCILAPLRPY